MQSSHCTVITKTKRKIASHKNLPERRSTRGSSQQPRATLRSTTGTSPRCWHRGMGPVQHRAGVSVPITVEVTGCQERRANFALHGESRRRQGIRQVLKDLPDHRSTRCSSGCDSANSFHWQATLFSVQPETDQLPVNCTTAGSTVLRATRESTINTALITTYFFTTLGRRLSPVLTNTDKHKSIRNR